MKESDSFNPKEYHSKKGHAHTKNLELPILFFDVVGFSKEMDNEGSKQIVTDMQRVMWDLLENNFYWAEKSKHASKNNLLLIPTGDGYGIAINETKNDDDILWIARKLYRALAEKKINIRMGIAKGRNVVTIDLNENLNIFGYGIVLATRVCNAASDGQILVHSEFAQSLQQDKAMPELTKIKIPFTAKHGLKIHCHNYFQENDFGINL
jgi:class 3 adenylate cyclase